MAGPPRSPREARRLERLKHGSRAARDVHPRPPSAPRQATKRKAPVLGSIADASEEATVVLSRRAVERLAQGHVWIYRSDIAAPETRRKLGIDDGFIRLSVGIENGQDLVDDLLQALERI